MAHHCFIPRNSRRSDLEYNFKRAVVVEWQTRYLEGVVGVRPWRFESSLPHHNFSNGNPLRRKGFFVVCVDTNEHSG
jgi:hypothetical protein